MTDSDSFDSGDLISGADLQALHARVAAACTAAGVAGPGSGSGDYAAGSAICAAPVSDLVAAYQRAWDASTNKPGSRQAQVAAGGTVHGALFQNLWTQLGQMAFGDYAPDADTFVCAFAAASGNDTGAGLGLSGSDLVVEQGNWGAAAGAPPRRTVAATTASSQVPAAVLNAMLAGPSWSFIMRLKDIGSRVDGNYLGWNASGGVNCLLLGHEPGYPYFYVHNGSAVLLAGVPANTPAASGDIWLVWDSDGSEIVAGWCTAKPVNRSDIPAGNRIVAAVSGGGFGANPAQKVLGHYGVLGAATAGYYVVCARKSRINHAA